MTENNKKNWLKRILPEKTAYKILLLVMALVGIAFLAMLAVANAFPAGLTMFLVIILFVLLVLGGFLLGRKKKGARIGGIAVAVIFMIFYGLGTYYLGETYALIAKVSNDDTTVAHTTGLDLSEDSFNVYITGIDQWAKEKGLDLERSDVNMIVTVCPKTRKILLTSIPRDTYIELYHVPEMDKLTHTGIYGVEETINSVEKWLGLDMNYYVKLNFSSVRDIINAMGGIDVYSPVAFTTSLWGYKFKKGWNHLDGKEALFFARERKAFEGKDSLRVENQQRVVKACIDKLTSSSTLLTKYGDIMDAAGKNMQTDMSTSDIQSLVKMQLADLGAWDIESQKVEGEYAMDYVASMAQTAQYQVYKPDPASVSSVISNIKGVMNPTEEEILAAEENRKKNSLIRFIKGLVFKNDDPADTEEQEG